MAAVELPDAAARKAAQAAAAAAAPSPAASAAAQKAALEAHFWRVITQWVCSKDSARPETRQTSVSAPVVGLLDEAVLVKWETALHAKGYATERADRLFTVKLPA